MKSVNETWAQDCDNFAFVLKTNKSLKFPIINVPIKIENRGNILNKTLNAIQYLSDAHKVKYDFYLKADDDTFVIMNNLRSAVENLDPESPVYLGRRLKKFLKNGYNSGGAGYILSRKSLIKIAQGVVSNSSACPREGLEDVGIGLCAENLGIEILDSRDNLGRERFHPSNPFSAFIGVDASPWLQSYNYYPLRSGFDCCSDESISFHYISPSQMYTLNLLTKHIRIRKR